MKERKKKEEHKGKLLSLSVLSQAEPGVCLISPTHPKCLYMEAPKNSPMPPYRGIFFSGCRTTKKENRRKKELHFPGRFMQLN